jgi:nicotinamidase-related amidase
MYFFSPLGTPKKRGLQTASQLLPPKRVFNRRSFIFSFFSVGGLCINMHYVLKFGFEILFLVTFLWKNVECVKKMEVVMAETLVLIDIQNDYFEGGKMPLVGALAAGTQAAGLLGLFREMNWPVIHVQHIANREGSSFFLPNTSGVEFWPGVAPLDHETVVVKHSPNSFAGTELYAKLTRAGGNDLLVCGMMTHMCVDATVRAAKDLGFAISLVGDACATRDLQSFGELVPARMVQLSFLAALDGFYSRVVSLEDFTSDL